MSVSQAVKEKLSASIHFEASNAIGLGHAKRCLALADALCEIDIETSLVTNREAITLVPGIMSHRVVHPSDTLKSASDICVFDLYRPVDRQMHDVIGRGLVAVIEDEPLRPHDCDILIDQSAERDRVDYAGLIPEKAYSLLGLPYALVGSSVRRARTRRVQRPSCKQLLLTLGGGLVWDQLHPIITATTNRFPDLNIVVAMVNDTEKRQRLNVGEQVSYAISHPDLPSVMAESDVAISASGVTAMELAHIGVPSILVSLAPNQNDLRRCLVSSGAALEAQIECPQSVCDALARLVSDRALRDRMATSGRRLIDGKGAARVATEIVNRAQLKNMGRQ